MDRQRERELIERGASGDRRACGTLISSYQPSLYAYMLRLSGRPDVAEDITQEAFVRVLTNLQRFDPQYRFSTWLFTIAKRLYMNACQKHKPAYDTDTIGALAGDRTRPEAPVVEREERRTDRGAIDRAMARLSEDQRQVLLLYHQQDWPIAIIADHLDMPEGTVKSHLHRGRRRLRVLLEQEERYRPAAQSDVDTTVAEPVVRVRASVRDGARQGGVR